jgi:DNA-binding IclR family transcriptional regulator
MKRSERRPVSKALHALHWFVESSRPHIGVRQLAAAMDIAPSSAHRILAALSEAGLVRRDTRSQRYGLTPEFFRLSHLAVAMSPLRQAGLAAMQRLTDTCHESALLCLYDDVCVTLPAQRIGEDGQGQLADAVRRCAGDITARMSGVEAETTLA